jgi:hypothetical protein
MLRIVEMTDILSTKYEGLIYLPRYIRPLYLVERISVISTILSVLQLLHT